MPLFVSQGRYTEGAIKAMLAKPEDRTAAVAKLVDRAGGKLIAFYLLFGEYDWMIVYEAPSGQEAAAIMLAAVGAGAITNTKTMLAMSGAEAQAAFELGRALGAEHGVPGPSRAGRP
ncbi:GYD domain-containing protein [Benzoatithermus flavus]|uniref:GYD domain-containing protein n=1 Tax=Benzoatithermus flavus TaxID=3108223 RepID=A0ABU8XND5_9PROT